MSRGAWELEIWRPGKQESWGAGELGSWRTGELEVRGAWRTSRRNGEQADRKGIYLEFLYLAQRTVLCLKRVHFNIRLLRALSQDTLTQINI